MYIAVNSRRNAVGSLAVLLSLGVQSVPALAGSTFTYDAQITGVTHQFTPGVGAVDALTLVPSAATVDPSLYTTYVFNYYTAPNTYVEVAPPPTITSYDGYYVGDLVNGATNPSSGNVSIKFDNFKGDPGSPVFSLVSDSTTGGLGATVEHEYSGPISFTGFTLTITNLPPGSVPSGLGTYNDLGSYFKYDTSLVTDPGAVVTVNDPLVPEPGAIPFASSMALSGALCVCKRRSRRTARSV